MRTALAASLLLSCSIVTDPGAFEEAPAAGSDSGNQDTGAEDAAVEDTAVEDTGAEDTSTPEDTSMPEDTSTPPQDTGITCPSGEQLVPQTCGATPVCQLPPDTCDGPEVCGCDMMLYPNRCELHRAGQAMRDISECESMPPGPSCCMGPADCATTEVCVRPSSDVRGQCLPSPPNPMCFRTQECPGSQQCQGAITCECAQAGCMPRPGTCR